MEGEALAVLEAMNEMHQRGYTNVMIETDSQIVAEAINSSRTGVSEFSSIISKIKCMLSMRNDFEMKSIRRQATMVAHTLARAAVSWPSRCTFETLPLCITSILFNEMI
jgi:ribonuclease HI